MEYDPFIKSPLASRNYREGLTWCNLVTFKNLNQRNPCTPPCGRVPGSNVQRFRGGLVFKAHRLLYHSTPGVGVIKKKKYRGPAEISVRDFCVHLGHAAYSGPYLTM